MFTKQSWLFETVWKATTALEASRTELEDTGRLLRNLLLMQPGYGFATADVIVDTTRINYACDVCSYCVATKPAFVRLLRWSDLVHRGEVKVNADKFRAKAGAKDCSGSY